jgi:hypothetical protein
MEHTHDRRPEPVRRKVTDGATAAASAPSAPMPLSAKAGLPDGLKVGVEALSGVKLDDVKVHYNSTKPGQLSAHAYAQGTDIHVAPGQEQHLPHEAWHVVQQKQGRVRSALQTHGAVTSDEDAALDAEAAAKGAEAARTAPEVQL